MRIFGLYCLFPVMLTVSGGFGATPEVEQYHVYEIVLTGSREHANPFMVDVSATIKGPGWVKMVVPGFYDGKNTWRIRFSPTETGLWQYATRCDVDPAMNWQRGQIESVPNAHSNIHGGLKIDREHPHHFVYEDGTRYFLLGFEADWAWALGMSDRDLSKLKGFVDTVADYGFNHIVMNAYAHDTAWARGKSSDWDHGPPNMYAWEGTNDSPDHSRMNVRFWQHYDSLIRYLQEKGIVAHIMMRVYNKLVDWPRNNSPEDWLYYRYIIARYQAFSNVVWDFSKEAHNEKNAEYKIRVLKAVKTWDAHDRLITVHDDNGNYDNGNYDICDFRSDQQHGRWGETIQSQRKARTWPVVNIEYGYERGVDDLPTYGVKQDWQEVLRRTYEIICAGGYPNYYYSNTSWDVIKWQPEPPGWKRYRILRDFLDGVEYWTMSPKERTGGCWVFANEGKEYLIFAPGGEAEFTVSNAPSSLHGQWFNIETGERKDAGTFANGYHSKDSPFGKTPVVLHLCLR